MRAADIAELDACGTTPHKALARGAIVSDECVTVVGSEGEILVIYGVAPGCRLTGMGRPWLLGTDAALNYKREFLTMPKTVIPAMLTHYDRLENYVHVENRISVRWLKLLGFKMDDPVENRITGEKFMRFSLKREDYV